jgi:threonine dehydrogenase-like Zn-dependent dehydrogenase
MKAITLESPAQLRLISMAEPHSPAPGEALVRMRQVGVCGTGFHAFRGEQPFFMYPRILGHELGVEIVAVNPQEQILTVGTRCAESGRALQYHPAAILARLVFVQLPMRCSTN